MSQSKTTGYRLFKDGTAWCATPPHFVDLQSSPAGFGDTQEEAVIALLDNRWFQTWLRRGSGRVPMMADFTIE